MLSRQHDVRACCASRTVFSSENGRDHVIEKTSQGRPSERCFISDRRNQPRLVTYQVVSRELRSLVPFEVAAVLAIALVPLPELVPFAMPLLVIGTLSLWIRRRSWADVTQPAPETFGSGARAGIGALAGVIALGIAIAIGNREATTLSPIPIAGSVQMGLMAVLHVAVTALAAELALRGWIVDRVIELSPGVPVVPICVGALAEAIVTPGDAATRVGAALFGVGAGWLFVAGGRNIIAPIFARIVFQVGAVAIEASGLV